MVYLAAPYSHPDPAIVAERMDRFCQVFAKMISDGMHVVSPLLCHFVLPYGKLPSDWNYWQNYSKALIDQCETMYVIMMPGWLESEGVTAEIQYARSINKKIWYV